MSPGRTTSLGAASALMALGTIASRTTGFVRAAVLTAVLGVALTGELFAVANTIPTSLYILVGGGVLNTVLVPQLVKAIRNDPDGGEAFAQRLTTAVVVVLLTATVLFVVFAPQVLRVYAGAYFEPGREEQLAAMVAFARYCLPQVFFYGIYLLLGQMLNARDSYGPMMWSPVLNNLVAIAVFGGYLVLYGPLDPRAGQFTPAQEAWFGLGSTLGIALQALVLLPVLRRSGLRLRFRRDLHGLGTSARLGGWTVLFVLVTQLTLIVIINIATAASARAADTPSGGAAGLAVFNAAFMLVQLPHAVVTVSLATALLPSMSRSALAGESQQLRDDLVAGMRRSLALVVPAAVFLAVLSVPLCGFVFGWGAGGPDFGRIALTVVAMAPGSLFFAVQFLTLRGFYALEDTRTPFVVQLVAVSPVYIAVAWGLTALGVYPPAAIGAGYSAAYLVATMVTSRVLSRRLGRPALQGIVRFAGRVLLAALPAGALCAVLVVTLPRVVPAVPGLTDAADGVGDPLGSLLLLGLAGAPGALVYLGLARLLRLEEVTSLVGAVARVARRMRPGRS